MDLSIFDTKNAEAGIDMTLLDPVGEPLNIDGKPVKIKLLGSDSVAYRTKHQQQAQKRLSAAMKKGQLKDIPLESEKDKAELAAECTVGFSSNMMDGGKQVKFSKEAALDLYLKYPQVREQATAFIEERANFFKSA